MVKGSGSGIFPDPDPGDPKRPDPTGSGSGSAKLVRSAFTQKPESHFKSELTHISVLIL